MLELKNVTIIIKNNDRPLVKNLNLTLNKGDKIAIIGEEGNGKSTLIKSIYNKELIEDYCYFEGQIIKEYLNIGYLEQFLDSKWNNSSINDYFLKNDSENELNYEKYEVFPNIMALLSKFKMNPELVYSDQLINTLSGGEKIKIQLAKILSKNPKILLLDEPTNDLDIDTLIWLEQFINSVETPILYISHDETLLENTANGIIHLEQIKRKTESKCTVEKIGYKDYVEKRLGLIQKQSKIAKKQREEYQAKLEQWNQVYQKVNYQQATITRADPHGGKLLKKKMKSLKAQQKRFTQNEEKFFEIPDVEESINLSFNSDIYIPKSKQILNLFLENLCIENQILSKNINLTINGPEHITIIGRNGIGKSTLLKFIYSKLVIREDLKVGFMPQNYESILNFEQNAIDFLKTSNKTKDITKARTLMGCVKFTEEEMLYKIGNLSGGQIAKILLLKLILENCNVLILDEPTRNLSPLSNPIIRELLSYYNGVIISVSHDRKFIQEVADAIYELNSDGLHLKNNLDL